MPDFALRLTQEEIDNLWEKLPAAMQKHWKPMLTVESLQSFETEQELTKRMKTVRLDDIPGMKEFTDEFVQTIEKGDLTKASLKNMPQVAILRHFYSIGACGMSALIGIMLQDPALDEPAMQAVADFSVIRHAILESNASVKA